METKFGYVKLTLEPIEIECVTDGDDAKATFVFRNQRYFLDQFIKVHDNPWLGSAVQYPEYIHAMEADSYNPLFIEIVDGGSGVNVYE